ncbi:MAG TPA: S46 family peptidase [Steroidobacteraceae bacterium]|nr:S46 family peptidase [Steroidobacteraceae bacterium]
MTLSTAAFLVTLSCWSLRVDAAEGMWTLDNLPRAELESKYHFEPDQIWLELVSHASLRLLPGCSASFVSPRGLVLTNHHCIRRCLEALSTPRRDLLSNGYLAATPASELRCPGMELNQLESTTDITAAINEATKGKEGEEFSRAYSRKAAELNEVCLHSKDDAAVRCDLIGLYHGGRYIINRYHRYLDVRLVWIPEFAIAFFGGDLNNYSFPRYNLDAAILRAYDGDRPVVSTSYFPVNRSGPAANELLIEAGHPAVTQRELTVDQLKTLRDNKLLRVILLLSEYRGVLQQYSKSSRSAARYAANEIYSVENRLKSLRGQLASLQDDTLLTNKVIEEGALKNFVFTHPEFLEARNAWQQIATAQEKYRAIGNEYYFLENEKGFLSRYFTIARILVRGAAEHSKPNEQRLPEFADSMRAETENVLFSPAPIFPEFEKVKLSWALTKLQEWLGGENALVNSLFNGLSPDALANKLVRETHLGDVDVRKTLWEHPGRVSASSDPFIRLAMMVDETARKTRRRYEIEVEGVEQKAGQQLSEARFAMRGMGIYPDATFSLRLSFGEVQAWQDNGRDIEPFTYVGGVYERNTGAEPFALPASWLKMKSDDLKNLPFNYVTTHDSVGGNSGSAIINRKGELVGLAFDGNIHSLGGTFGYDADTNRAVILHPAALMHALEKIYKADELLNELETK